ncbi:MAG TPA: peptide-methionine (R)-S-oxide reductase MsrB [Flavobacteriaceae bacterium]|nr:peptide-methionine (R)-S-oxide reductase MsrB [Flavobacteriaceae bacterium]
MMRIIGILILLSIFFSCEGKAQQEEKNDFSVEKTEEEWKSMLTPEQFYVLRNDGTERPFSSSLLKLNENGNLHCVACDNLLFRSKDQFDADCGWPSFDKPVEGAVVYKDDYKIGYKRIDVRCAECDGHLGHVFEDGPKETTGKRYCINGVALKFTPEEE